MKKIILLLVAIVLIACSADAGIKDYASIKGKLNKLDVSSISVQGKDFSKDIKVAEDGTFSDTLKVVVYVYAFSRSR